MTWLRRCLPLLLLAVPPATAAASPERVIASSEANGCTLSVADQDRTLRLRLAPHGCRASREAVQRLLEAAFARAEPPRPEGPYTSLFIGRLVEYPWAAEHLASTAAADRRWDRRAGKAVGTGTYAFVAAVLSEPAVTAPFEAALRGSGYRIRSATVEKVLILELRKAPEYEGARPPGKLPFDAMVWFNLEKRAPSGER